MSHTHRGLSNAAARRASLGQRLGATCGGGSLSLGLPSFDGLLLIVWLYFG
jgi:hypothetical protein